MKVEKKSKIKCQCIVLNWERELNFTQTGFLSHNARNKPCTTPVPTLWELLIRSILFSDKSPISMIPTGLESPIRMRCRGNSYDPVKL